MPKKIKNPLFNYEFLNNLVEQNLTLKQIGKILEIGEKYSGKILKKFGLRTKISISKELATIEKNKGRICVNCQKLTLNPKFCCKSCAISYINKTTPPKRKRTKKCSKCDNLIKRWDYTLCEEHWLEHLSNKKEAIRELTLADYWAKNSLKNLHVSSKNAHIRGLARSWFKELVNLPCFKCGYNKHVELCHIKAIKDFDETAKLKEVNGENNIIQLCPNCHWEFDKSLFSLNDIGWSPK